MAALYCNLLIHDFFFYHVAFKGNVLPEIAICLYMIGFSLKSDKRKVLRIDTTFNRSNHFQPCQGIALQAPPIEDALLFPGHVQGSLPSISFSITGLVGPHVHQTSP